MRSSEASGSSQGCWKPKDGECTLLVFVHAKERDNCAGRHQGLSSSPTDMDTSCLDVRLSRPLYAKFELRHESLANCLLDFRLGEGESFFRGYFCVLRFDGMGITSWF